MISDEDKVWGAIADPTRRQVLEVLVHEPLPVGVLAQRLPVSRPAVSQHLRVLGEAGLVSSTAVGTRRVYALRPDGLALLREWLDAMWQNALEAFATAVETQREEETR